MYGSTLGEPLITSLKALIYLDKTNSLPTYSDADVPILDVFTPYDTNFLEARPYNAGPIPIPTHSMYLEIVFDSDPVTEVNLAYINGESYPCKYFLLL